MKFSQKILILFLCMLVATPYMSLRLKTYLNRSIEKNVVLKDTLGLVESEISFEDELVPMLLAFRTELCIAMAASDEREAVETGSDFFISASFAKNLYPPPEGV